MEKAPEMTEEESTVLINEYEARKNILDSDVRTAESGRKKTKAWQEIADAVNAISSYKRTVAQIRIKLKNLKSKAKSNYMSLKRQVNQTGGGPPPKQMSQAEDKLVSMYQGSVSWEGIPGGCSSSIIPRVDNTNDNAPEQAMTDSASASSNVMDQNANGKRSVNSCDDLSVRRIRRLQITALETQIEANNAIVATCTRINNELIPTLLSAFGFSNSNDVLKDICDNC